MNKRVKVIPIWRAGKGKKGTGRFYPMLQSNGKKGIVEIAQRLSRDTVLSPFMIEMMLDRFLHLLPQLLAEGYVIKLDSLGELELEVIGSGVADPNQICPNMIRELRPVFKPSRKFIYMLRRMEYE